MTNVLLFALVALQIYGIYSFREILRHIVIHEPEVPRQKPLVTPTDPRFVNESKIGQGESQIITPKTPQRIDFEESEELRKMQLPR